MQQPSRHTSGSALIFALLCAVVLSVFVGETIRLVENKYRNVYHAASWQESLLAAESGVDVAMVELRKSLSNPSAAWQSPWSGVAPGNGTTSYSLSGITYSGEGGTKMTMQIYVDAPSELVHSNGWQYYRIRAIGTNTVPGPPRTTDEKRDAVLRKLSLQIDRFSGNRVLSPQVSRKIEVIARPASPFNAAILARGLINITDQNVVVDSYDSRDSAKSTSGQYDINKRQSNGDVASDGALITAGNSHIYGDVATNNGNATGIANVTGTIRTDFYQDVPLVKNPTWTSVTSNTGPVSNTSTRAANAVKGAARYIISSISVSGNDTFTITGNPSGTPTYAEIWVQGGISVSGNAKIIVQDGVIATFYVQDDMKIAGNGISNGTSSSSANRAGNVVIYGLTPTDGHKLQVSLAGNGQIEAGVYAPGADVSLDGGGSSGAFFGSVVGDTIKLTGVERFHYDEAMTTTGAITDYRIASWFEDSK